MNYNKFVREVEKGKIAPVYLFEGEEDYLKEEALKMLKGKVISPEYEDFNYEVLPAAEISDIQIMESLSILPFKGRWRLVVIKEIDKLARKAQKAIGEYLNRPVKSTCLVCTAKKLDKRTKFYSLFLERGKVVSFRPLWDEEALTWIRERVEKKGKKIALEAAVYLLEKIGNDLHSLDNEIEKLAVFVHPDQLVGVEEVRKVAGEGKGEGVFGLTKAIREKDLAKAFFILSQLEEEGEDPLRIHSLIVREIRILLRLKEKEKSISPYQACPIIFSQKKFYPKFYQDIAAEYIQAAKKFTLRELIKGYERLLETEISIKTGREDPNSAMEKLVLNLLTPHPL